MLRETLAARLEAICAKRWCRLVEEAAESKLQRVLRSRLQEASSRRARAAEAPEHGESSMTACVHQPQDGCVKHVLCLSPAL